MNYQRIPRRFPAGQLKWRFPAGDFWIISPKKGGNSARQAAKTVSKPLSSPNICFWHCTSGEFQPLAKSNPIRQVESNFEVQNGSGNTIHLASPLKKWPCLGGSRGSHVSCLTQRQAAIPKTSVHPSPAPSCVAGLGRCQCVPVQWWMSRKNLGLFDIRGVGLLNDPTGM